VKWSTSNKKIITVDKKGKVTAKKKGSATITAKAGTKSYKCKVTVQSIGLNKKEATLYIPKGTYSAYYLSDWGSIFNNIIEMD
jgi:uncharacterized protein YjdB